MLIISGVLLEYTPLIYMKTKNIIYFDIIINDIAWVFHHVPES